MATKQRVKAKAPTSKAKAKAPPPKTPRVNYKAKYQDLQRQVDDVHRMLDACECPPNCGTVNGRLVEFAKDWLRRCGGMGATHPQMAAQKMLKAVDAPLWPL
jgi:hypothetical protein